MKIFILGGAVGDEAQDADKSSAEMRAACERMGANIASPSNVIVVCSPFDDSADAAVLKGLTAASKGRSVPVEFHFVDTPAVREKLNGLVKELGLERVTKVPHPPAESDSPKARQFAWLLCQLSALESANVTVAVGGDPDGSANMLLLVAEGRRKSLIPLPLLGGAAKRAFERRRYELEDRFGSKLALFHEHGAIDGVMELIEEFTTSAHRPQASRSEAPRFFISYPRARQAEADHVETVLRRRNLVVYRDESEFGAGYQLPETIRQALFASDVFIAIWCAEYACSPWCFDELELALDRQANHGLNLWIFRVDETRIVPPRARNTVYYDVKSRQELEGKLLDLLNRHATPSFVS